MKEDFDLEKEKLELERQKLKWERERFTKNLELELEKSKKENGLNFKNIIPGISIIISVLIVIVTLLANDQSQIKQNEAERNLAELSAANDFQIKAAEIVMNSANPGEVRAKAVALKRLFGDKLPQNFAENFETKGISGPNKDKIIDLLSEHPENRQQILHDWALLWPADKNLINNLTLGDFGMP